MESAASNTGLHSLDPLPMAEVFQFVGDHHALDFLNTVAAIDGRLVDFLTSDEDVLRWLHQTRLLEDKIAPPDPSSSLLNAARSLREEIRELVAKRRAGEEGDTAALNTFLKKTPSYPQLEWVSEKAPVIEWVREGGSPEQILAPVAEAALDLLATGEFDLVRKCEDESCVLWFYDRTKSHRRRWCSMAACGNRNKVKAFRDRQKA